MAKVSIIIPTYNVEQYLRQCMDSVTGQTLQDIEIICINDGSTDGSLAILREYAERDSRIVMVDKENEGYGIGMNIGLDRAMGEYVGIVEPDDFVPEEMFEELYNKAKEYDLDVIKADFYRFTTNDDGTLDRKYIKLYGDSEEYNRVIRPLDEPNVSFRFTMNTWSGIYKREFLNKYNIRHNTTPGASFQDNGFWWQTFMYADRVMIVDKPYYHNRRDNMGSSVKNPGKVYCMNVEYDYIRELTIKYPEKWKALQGIYWFKKYHNYLFTLERISDEFKKEYCHRFSAEFRRARQLGELDMSVYTSNEKKIIKCLIENPDTFYRVIMKTNSLASAELVRRIERKPGRIVINGLKRMLPYSVKKKMKKAAKRVLKRG